MFKSIKKVVLGASMVLLVTTGIQWNTSQVVAAETQYYVSTSGSDSNAGTLNAPWKTLQHAADVATAGSTVYIRGGTYNQKLKITKSGSSTGAITFSNYASEKPIIDGTGLSVTGLEGLIDIQNADYITIQGLELSNYKTATKDLLPIGIYVHGKGSNIKLLNNKIHDIKSTATPTSTPSGDIWLGRDAHGIAVYGTQAPASINNLTISGNELYNLVLGTSEALVVNGNVDTFSILNNTIHDADNIGIDVIGFEGKSPTVAYDQARNGLIQGNKVYNITSNNNVSYGPVPNNTNSADGIYVDGGKDTIIERNYSYNNDIGIEIASEHAGKATDNITVRSNMVYKNRLTGIAMGGYDTGRGSTTNSKIVNNTLYKNDTLGDDNGQLLVQYDTSNNIIKNNIMVAGTSNALITNPYTKNSGNVVDYNLYFASGSSDSTFWIWKNKEYNGFAAYKSGSGNDAHSIFADPKFVNVSADNYHIQATSPAVDKGSTDTAIIGTADIDGQNRVSGSAVNIGADE